MNAQALYHRYAPMVLRRCRALLREEQAALDAMQDTFERVIRANNPLLAPSALLYTVATNVCLNRLRTRKRRPETDDDALLLRIAVAPDAEEIGGARLTLARLFAAEQPSTRTIAVLHLVDGLTLEEVASEVGLSVGGVRKRLARLKTHIRELEAL